MPKGKIIKDWEKQTVTILDKTYSLKAIPTEMQAMCSFHGFCQKLGDTTAGMKDFNQAEKSAAIDKVYENLVNGLWRKPGEQAQTMKKRVNTALSTATKEQIDVMVQLNFITQQEAEAELAGRLIKTPKLTSTVAQKSNKK